MSRTGILILLGVLIILTPFSGLPIALRTLLSVIFGACVAAIGLTLRAREARHQRQPVTPSSTPEPSTPSGVSPI